MGLCIKDIMANPVLKTQAMTQHLQADLAVHWAHVCELNDPTEWLGAGDLLMTTGIGIPAQAEEQIAYVQRLAQAQLAGIVIGNDMQAPADISALLAEAERLQFNVLSMAYEVPFSAITKVIIEDKEHQEHVKRTAITQVYETARLSIQGMGLERLIGKLQLDIQSPLYLVDPQTWQPWSVGLSALPEAVRLVCVASGSVEKHPLSTLQRFMADAEEWLRLPLPTQNAASIVVKNSHWTDYILMNHVAAVVGIELERTRFEYENVLRLGAELFEELIQQRLPEMHTLERLQPFRYDLKQAHVFSFKSDRALLNLWNEWLCRKGIRVLFKKQPNRVLGLCIDVADLAQIQVLLGHAIGYSAPIGTVYRLPEAIHESQLALEFCNANEALVAYDACSNIPFWLPANLDIAKQVFDTVLGELERYDVHNHSKLVLSLKVFLEENKSWKTASERLRVHKQSLIYRIKKIEDITQRSLNRIDDVTILWFAIKSGMLIGKI